MAYVLYYHLLISDMQETVLICRLRNGIPTLNRILPRCTNQVLPSDCIHEFERLRCRSRRFLLFTRRRWSWSLSLTVVYLSIERAFKSEEFSELIKLNLPHTSTASIPINNPLIVVSLISPILDRVLQSWIEWALNSEHSNPELQTDSDIDHSRLKISPLFCEC